jgi:hypothetical protein
MKIGFVGLGNVSLRAKGFLSELTDSEPKRKGIEI